MLEIMVPGFERQAVSPGKVEQYFAVESEMLLTTRGSECEPRKIVSVEAKS